MNEPVIPCSQYLQNDNLPEINWTGSKSDFIELCYALLARGVINNGNIKIKELVSSMEKMFNFDGGDCYSTYINIKKRKNDRLQFLTSLCSSLNRKIEDEEM